MMAAFHGEVTVEKVLLDRGADIEARDEAYGSTALMTASAMSRTAVIQLLLDRGGDVNAPNENGWTPLMAASFSNEPDAAALLLSRKRIWMPAKMRAGRLLISPPQRETIR